MANLNPKLLKIYSISTLASIVTGILIHWLFAPPDMAIAIDRSYCPPTQWQTIVSDYADLYQQHQQHDITIRSVVIFSSLGEEVRSPPPPPAEIAALSTYGRKDIDRQQRLQQQHPQTKFLACP